jgi:uncharacterized protein YjbJ (UPF0337 family)
MKDQMQGRLEELWGRLSGDRALQAKGMARQVVGEAKRVGREIAYDVERPGRPSGKPPDKR